MFGAIFIFTLIICGIVYIISSAIENSENKKKYKDNISNTYMGYDGIYRDLDTDKPRFMYRQNGDRYMKGDDIGIVNISQLERDKEYEQAKNKSIDGKTVSFYSNEPANAYTCERIKKGVRYKDLENGEIYVVRQDRYRNRFFVTLNNRVVRFTDMERKNKIEFNNYDEQKEKELVREFQEEINKASNDPYWKDPTVIFQHTNVSSLRG